MNEEIHLIWSCQTYITLTLNFVYVGIDVRVCSNLLAGIQIQTYDMKVQKDSSEIHTVYIDSNYYIALLI